MKKLLVLIILLCLLILLYRSIFCFRLIAFSNTGDKKYKMSQLEYFPEIPLSIINPFKEKSAKGIIKEYCESGRFYNYYKTQFKDVKSRNYVLYQDYCANNKLDIESIKEVEGRTLFLLEGYEYQNELQIVFIFDNQTNEIIGFY